MPKVRKEMEGSTEIKITRLPLLFYFSYRDVFGILKERDMVIYLRTIIYQVHEYRNLVEHI